MQTAMEAGQAAGPSLPKAPAALAPWALTHLLWDEDQGWASADGP